MADVVITLGNGNIGGLVAQDDGTCGVVLTGATEGTVTAGTPFLLSSAADVTALGLTAGNNPLAVKVLNSAVAEAALLNVNQFQLYVLIVASTMTVAQMADVTNANGAKKLVDFAGNKIRWIAVCSNDTAVGSITVTNGINADCYTAKDNLHALCVSYATDQKPMRGIVGGTSFSGTASALSDLTAGTKNRAGILIGDTVSGDGAAVGLWIGRRMALPVQRKVSRVKDGPVSSSTIFFNTTAGDQFTGVETIQGKGFITFRTLANKTGFYFRDEPAATATTDDYHLLVRGGVIDKAHRIAYATYIEEIDEEVPVNADGTIDAKFAGYLEAIIERQMNLNMTALKNISSVRAFVDTAQNVVATSKVTIVLKVTPVGYLSEIDVTLGFDIGG